MALRPHAGQTAAAANLRRLLAGSAIVASHRTDDARVQDAYSLRCTPQVHGAATRHRCRTPGGSPTSSSARRSTTRPCCPTGGSSRAATSTARRSASPATSWRSPSPRPARSPSAGPIGCSTSAARTVCRRSSPRTPGSNSGMMIAHYTQAAMVAENRRLAVPASVDSLPTSAMQEDHVSMGWGAARKLRRAVANLGRIVAGELVCAARGARPARPAAAGAGDRRGARRAARRRGRRTGPGSLAGARAGARRTSSCCRRACSTAVEHSIGALE